MGPLLCFLVDDDLDNQEIFCMALDELNEGRKTLEKILTINDRYY